MGRNHAPLFSELFAVAGKIEAPPKGGLPGCAVDGDGVQGKVGGWWG